MKLLLINTCGGAADMVALAETSARPQILAGSALRPLGNSEQILPALRSLLATTGCGITAVDTIVVVDGPGSFTGERVGLSVAKGLCEATGARLVAVSRLALLAGTGDVLALLDAGRGEFFSGSYRAGVYESEKLLRRSDVEAAATGREIVISEPKLTGSLAGLPFRLVPEPDAAAILHLACKRVDAGLWTDIASADANYQRQTDAELSKHPATAALP